MCFIVRKRNMGQTQNLVMHLLSFHHYLLLNTNFKKRSNDGMTKKKEKKKKDKMIDSTLPTRKCIIPLLYI